jgi:hypothetical protein
MGGEVKNMRGLMCAVVAALVVVAGCGRAPAPPVAGGDYKLYEAASTGNSQLVAVIGTRSQSVERTMPWGTLAGKHLYSVRNATLSDIDPQTGSTIRSLRLPYTFQLPQVTASGVAGGLSQDGRWLVLEHPAGNPDQVDSSGSHMLVVDTSLMKVTAPIDLPGSFQFDAISNDGQRVYMIEYLSGANYRVRVYNVPAKHLESYVVVDKSDAKESMTGIRLSGVPSPDGQWLYSVYARPNKGAFIHALNLGNPFAVCLELPGSGYATSPDELQWSLALSADGSRLFAANGAKGIVAEFNTDNNGFPAIVRTARIDSSNQAVGMLVQDVEAKEFGSGGAVLSTDGKTLVVTGKTGLVWVDTGTLHARSRHLANWTVWSLGVSPDGNMVYALSDTEKIAELSMANPDVPAIFSASAAQPMALIRVDSAPAP